MNLPLILDFVVIGVLVATIVYAIILNKKLSALNHKKEELRGFLETFATSLAQAKAGVDHLKKVSYDSAQALQSQIREGRALQEELGSLVEDGEKACIHLNAALKESQRSLEVRNPAPKPKAPKKAQKKAFPARRVRKASSASKTPPAANQAGTPRTASKAAPQHPRVEPRLVQALRGLR